MPSKSQISTNSSLEAKLESPLTTDWNPWTVTKRIETDRSLYIEEVTVWGDVRLTYKEKNTEIKVTETQEGIILHSTMPDKIIQETITSIVPAVKNTANYLQKSYEKMKKEQLNNTQRFLYQLPTERMIIKNYSEKPQEKSSEKQCLPCWRNRTHIDRTLETPKAKAKQEIKRNALTLNETIGDIIVESL